MPAAAAYDDPLAQAQFTVSRGPHERSTTLILDGIRCAACLWLIEQTLRRLPGVLQASVNYTTRRAQVAWDPARIRLSAIIGALRAVGYDAYPYDPQRQSLLERDARRQALWRLFVAGFGAMQVMMYAFPAYVDEGVGTLSADAERLMRWASLVLTLPVVAFACGPFFAGAWRELAAAAPGHGHADRARHRRRFCRQRLGHGERQRRGVLRLDRDAGLPAAGRALSRTRRAPARGALARQALPLVGFHGFSFERREFRSGASA